MALHTSAFREYIQSLTLYQALDSVNQVVSVEMMNEYFEVFSEKWIDCILNQPQEFFSNDDGQTRRFEQLFETIKASFIALLRKKAFENSHEGGIDLSPWPLIHIFNTKIGEINAFGGRGSRSRTNPEFLPEAYIQSSEYDYHILSIATALVLAALPLNGFNERDNAFMKPDRALRQTPLMYVLDNRHHFKKPVIEILCKRGGFSKGEWTSGKVMHTFCMLDNELATLLATNFSSDLTHYINQTLHFSSISWICKPLHYCCKSHAPQGLFQLVRLLMSLGADPTLVDNKDQTPFHIIQERRNRMAYADDEVETQNFDAVLELLYNYKA